MNAGIPIGSALPPRRDHLIEARDTTPNLTEAIVAPKARDRLFELIEREQLPGDVRDTLAGELTGDLRRQQLLFQAMLDTWPRLQKNLKEVLREVKKAPREFAPFSLRGKEADKAAMEKAELAEDPFWSMEPRVAWGEKGGPGLIEAPGFRRSSVEAGADPGDPAALPGPAFRAGSGSLHRASPAFQARGRRPVEE